MVPEFGDKFVLVSGNGSVMDVCKHYGFNKAIHTEELFAIMPQLSPLSKLEYPKDRMIANKAALTKRLGMNEHAILH